MIARTDPKPAAGPLPANATDVALIAANTCAAIGDMSVSWWHEEVRAGRAPRPVIQQPRCTRWLLPTVLDYWRERASQGAADTESAVRMTARAKKASLMARQAAAVAKAQPKGKSCIADVERGAAA